MRFSRSYFIILATTLFHPAGAFADDAARHLAILLDASATEQQKREAIKQLEKLGPEAKSAIPALTALFDPRKDTFYREAAAALRAIGPAGITAAIETIKPLDPNHTTHLHNNVLENLVPDGIVQIAPLVKSEDQSLRLSAMGALARAGFHIKTLEPEQLAAIRAVMPELIAEIDPPKPHPYRTDGPDTAAAVLTWLGAEAKAAGPVLARRNARHQSNGLVDALRKIDPKNAEALLRTAAAEYRREQNSKPPADGRPENIQKEIDRLTDVGARYNGRADGLRRWGELLRANLPKLQKALDAADPEKEYDRAAAAAAALAYAGEPGVAVLVKVLQDKSAPPRRRVIVARALREADPATPALVDALVAVLKEPLPPKPKVPASSGEQLAPVAIASLMYISEREVGTMLHRAAPTLAAIVNDERHEGQARADAASALRLMTPKPNAVLPELSKALLGDSLGRSFASGALVTFGAAAVPHVQKVLNDPIAGREAADILRKIAAEDPDGAAAIEKSATAAAPGKTGGGGGGGDAAVRRSIVEAAGQRGPEGVAKVIAGLSDPDGSVRTAAARTLGDAKIESLPQMAAAFSRLSDKRSRLPLASAIASVISRKGWAPPAEWQKQVKAAIPELIKGLSDPDPDVRGAVEKALANADETGVSALIDALQKNPDATVRAAAARALTVNPGREEEIAARARAVPALRTALKDKDPSVRAEAAMALGAMKDPAALPVLVEMIASDATRDRAKQQLIVYQGKQVPLILELLDNPDDTPVRDAAIQLLNTPGEGGGKILFGVLADPKASPRRKAGVLASLANGYGAQSADAASIKAAAPGMLAALQDADPLATWHAQLVIDRLPDPAVILGPALADANPRVRVTAARLMLQRRDGKVKTDGIAAAVVSALKTADPRTRESAVDVLYQLAARLGAGAPSETVPRLKLVTRAKEMKSSDPATRAKAAGDVATMHSVAARPVVPLLARLLRDADAGVVQAAEAALLKMFDPASNKTR